MLDEHLRSPVTRLRLRSGPAADYIDGFADWLDGHGFKPNTIDAMLRCLAGWTDWMRAAGFTQSDLLPGSRRARWRSPERPVAGIAAVPATSPGRRRDLHPVPSRTGSDPAGRGSSVSQPTLAGARGVPVLDAPTPRADTDIPGVYEGVLAGLLDALGDDPGAYTAERVRGFVLERAHPHGIGRAKTIVVAVRAFLRFLGATGQCQPEMRHAIPGFAGWQLSSVPRFLVPEDVERLIASCPTDTQGLRDKAVILLLARLGLRAGEVAQLAFADIDWGNGRITVCGKGRRQEWLPLSQEVGDAILLYLEKGRPPLRAPEVFTTVLAPCRPLTRAAVTHIVRGALRRAGIKAPINGAHVLRHSAATAMLRHGASLAGVGAVLRHRSPRTTAHYAKVDFALLAEITQPWPEAPSC